MKKFYFKREMRGRLMRQSDERREVIQATYKTLDAIAEKVSELRSDVLWEYDADIVNRNKDAAAYWGNIETALDGLYDAMENLRALSAIELIKWGKLHSPD